MMIGEHKTLHFLLFQISDWILVEKDSKTEQVCRKETTQENSTWNIHATIKLKFLEKCSSNFKVDS